MRFPVFESCSHYWWTSGILTCLFIVSLSFYLLTWTNISTNIHVRTLLICQLLCLSKKSVRINWLQGFYNKEYDRSGELMESRKNEHRLHIIVLQHSYCRNHRKNPKFQFKGLPCKRGFLITILTKFFTQVFLKNMPLKIYFKVYNLCFW